MLFYLLPIEVNTLAAGRSLMLPSSSNSSLEWKDFTDVDNVLRDEASM